MTCATCGHDQDRGRFCGRCGARLAPPADVPSSADGDGRETDAAEWTPHDRRRSPSRTWAIVATGAVLIFAVAVGLSSAGRVDEPSALASPSPSAASTQAPREPTTETVPITALPPEVRCSTRGGPESPDCAAWVLQSNAGPVRHMTTSGGRVLAAMDELVVAVDAVSGERLWEWLGGRPSALAATANHVLVTLEADHRYVLLDAATGTLRWEAPIEEERQAWQTIAGDVVVTRETTSLRVQTAVDGDVVWEVDLPPTGANGTPAVDGGVVVTAVSGGLNGYGLDDSKRRWTSDVAPTRPVLSWPFAFCPLYGDCPKVLVATEGHRVVALKATTGEELWEYPITQAVEEVADIGGDLIGVVSRGHVDVLRRTDGEHVTGLAAPPIRNLQPGRSGTFFAEVGSTVQEWRLERGRVWQLDAAMAAAPGYATVIGDDPPREEAVIVVPLGEGTTLAGFRTSTAPDDGWELPNSCDGLHPSWDLGDLDAWAGAGVVAALLDDRDGPQQLWVGLPGADTSAKVILTARPLDGSGTAVFSAFDDVWTDVLYVLGGGRTAANFPPHWVVAARFSETGCWELRVTVDGTHRTVVIPVTTPDPSAAAPRAYGSDDG